MPSSAASESRRSDTKAKHSASAKSAKRGDGKPSARKETNALQQPLKPSAELAAVVGEEPLPRTEVVRKVWEYIKSKNLQDPQDRRTILADDALGRVFGKDRVSMFEMNKHLARHLA